MLAADGFDIRAIDTDAEAIELTKNAGVQSGRLCRESLDFSRRPFEEEFDAVCERGVLHSVKSDQDRVDFAEQVALALKPGGLWFNATGSADDCRYDPRYGCLYSSQYIPPIEELFDVRLGKRRTSAFIEAGCHFDVRYCVPASFCSVDWRPSRRA